jgi:hypothetical protein
LAVALLFFFVSSLFAAAQQTGASPPPSPGERAQVQRLLGGPVSRDPDELVTQAAMLRAVGEGDKAQWVDAIAERFLLNATAGMPVGNVPSTLELAIAQEQAASPYPREWQKATLEKAVSYFATPTRADASVHSFRNETSAQLRAFTAALLVDGKALMYCERDAKLAPVGAGAIAEAKCRTEVSKPVPEDLHKQLRGRGEVSFPVTRIEFVPGGYVVGPSGGGFRADRREVARARMQAQSAIGQVASDPSPGMTTASTADARGADEARPPLTAKQRQNRRALGIASAAAVLLGIFVGLLIGAVASNRRMWIGLASIALTTVAVVGLLAYIHSLDMWGWRIDNILALIGLVIHGMTVVMFAALILAWLWLCAVAGLAAGTLAGYRLFQASPA